MRCVYGIFKTVIVVAVITGSAVLVTVLVLGRDKFKDLTTSLKAAVEDGADSLIDDRVRFERELGELSESYPKRIAAVRGAIREAEAHVAHIEREQEHVTAVLSLCANDIEELKTLLEAAPDSDAPDAIAFRGSFYKSTEAARLLERAEQTHEKYRRQREELDAEHTRAGEQIASLTSELEELRREQQEFETERQTILREIDRLEQNEKLIALTAGRADAETTAAATISLAQIRSELEHKRLEQEEQLKSLNPTKHDILDYDARLKEPTGKEQPAPVASIRGMQ